MFRVEINDDEISAALNQVALSLEDMSPLMQDLAEVLLVSTQDRMERGEQPDGASFAPRSPVTLERYAAMGLSFGAPLNQSGDMRSQLASSSGADYLEIGSNAIQAAVMHFGAQKGAFGTTSKGGSIPWGDIPARPFLGLSEADRDNVLAELGEWLERAANSAK